MPKTGILWPLSSKREVNKSGYQMVELYPEDYISRACYAVTENILKLRDLQPGFFGDRLRTV
jgi:hypothetical protein